MYVDISTLIDSLLITFLLIIGAATFSWYIGLHYTVILVLTGLILPFVPFLEPQHLSPELFMFILIPPLIFEAALTMGLDEVKRDFDIILSYAFVGVVISAFITGFLILLFTDIAVYEAFMFSSLIAATDPVAV